MYIAVTKENDIIFIATAILNIQKKKTNNF